jgi:hypothetical protein
MADSKKNSIEMAKYRDPDYVIKEFQSIRQTFKQIEKTKIQLSHLDLDLKEKRA